jgi:hypothetical protein
MGGNTRNVLSSPKGRVVMTSLKRGISTRRKDCSFFSLPVGFFPSISHYMGVANATLIDDELEMRTAFSRARRVFVFSAPVEEEETLRESTCSRTRSLWTGEGYMKGGFDAHRAILAQPPRNGKSELVG